MPSHYFIQFIFFNFGILLLRTPIGYLYFAFGYPLVYIYHKDAHRTIRPGCFAYKSKPLSGYQLYAYAALAETLRFTSHLLSSSKEYHSF